MCEEKDLLLSYLYDDIGDAERARFESHLRGCAECRDELNGLRGVRADLISWSPPQPDFGFRVVREPKVVELKPRGAWRAWWTPAAGLAAAAVLVLAAASAIARVEIHSGPDGFTVRTGWGTGPAGVTDSTARPGTVRAQDVALGPSTSPNAIDPATVSALEARLRALESAARSGGVRAASTTSARATDAEILRVVQDLLAQSESRQQTELARRVAQVMYDMNQKFAGEFSGINARFARLDSWANDEAERRREMTTAFLQSAKQK